MLAFARCAGSDAARVIQGALVKWPEEGRWPSFNNSVLDKATVAACPIQIDRVRLQLGHRA